MESLWLCCRQRNDILFIHIIIILNASRLFKIGTLLENILSRPALSGFTQGASILIACSQLKSVLGYHPDPPVPYTVDNLIHALVEYFPEINWWTALIGIPALVIILVMKKVKKTFPTIILVLCAGIFLSWQLDVYENVR